MLEKITQAGVLLKRRAAAGLAAVSSFAITAVPSAYAQSTFPTIPVTPSWISGEMCAIANWMFYFLIILSVIMVVAAAYIYLTSNGDPEKVGTATKTLTYAAVGILVGVLAKAIPTLVASIVGYSGLSVCH
jgi:hypothetical protein